MTKKNFDDITNPALQFITSPIEQQEDDATVLEEKAAGPKGVKRGRKPSTEETKTKRLNLLMFPSVYEDISKIATMKRVSINELTSSILQDYIANHLKLIEKYNEVFGEDD